MEYKELTDLELCRLASRGETKAIETLYKRHYELMLNFGLKYFNDADFIKDCIQDLFVKLICNPRLFSNVIYVRPWLLVALKNIIFDRLKTIKPHFPLDELPFSEISEEFIITAIREQMSDEEIDERQKVINAFNRLNGNQRMAVYLRYVKGLTHKELALMLNIKEQSSMNLLHRALTKLRRLLGGLCVLWF